MSDWDELVHQIELRAEGRCEYCLLHQDDSFFTHEIDHIYAEKHGGETSPSNLCCACADCNGHKGSDLCSLDPDTGNITALFHPRRDKWSDHFQLNPQNGVIEPLTAQGRVTAKVLQLNRGDLLIDRVHLIVLGRYEDS